MSNHLENVITILFLGSNFNNEKVVRTEKEFESIREILKTTYFGKLVNLKYAFAVKRKSLEAIIDKINPQVIHFSGHGTHYVGPLFDEDDDEFEFNSIDMTENLANILFKFREKIELVIFNVCESINIARQVAKFISFTVGAEGKTDDDSAIAFTKGFYEEWLNNDNVRKSVGKGNYQYNMELSKKKSTLKRGNTYALYSLMPNGSATSTKISFLDIMIEKTNLISHIFCSNPFFVRLTNYNYYFKRIKQINSDEFEKWNKKIPSDRLIKTQFSEDWAGHQLISPEDTTKIISKIIKIERNPKLDNDSLYRIQKGLDQYKFFIAKSNLINTLEVYDHFRNEKKKRKIIIESLATLLKRSKDIFQLLGFTYFNDDNTIRDKEYEVILFKNKKITNFSIRNLNSDETFFLKTNSNIQVLRDFKDYIKKL